VASGLTFVTTVGVLAVHDPAPANAAGRSPSTTVPGSADQVGSADTSGQAGGFTGGTSSSGGLGGATAGRFDDGQYGGGQYGGQYGGGQQSGGRSRGADTASRGS
jgi:single-strand DNA-binding protein